MFIHLHCHSPFSFLDGAASMESMVAQAAMYGMTALALTDHDTIAGLPEFHKWARAYGIKPISGAELTLEDGSHITVLAETSEGYTNLCRLLTISHDGAERRRQPRLPLEALFANAEGLIVLSGCRNGRIPKLLRQGNECEARETAARFLETFPGSFYLEVQADAYPGSNRINAQLEQLGAALQIPLVATSNVHYVSPSQFPVHDVLTCIRLRCDVRTPHGERPFNDRQWLHGPEEALERFAAYPEAIANTERIGERCQVVVKLNRDLFPAFDLPKSQTDAARYLRQKVYEGAAKRYPKVDAPLKQRLEHELSIIEQLGYVDYFLVVWDIVRFARSQRIRCAGRGSAADSAVAFCLYITDVDAAGRGLLFERFMSLERAERPDIDIDFDSRRRDEVIDYVYQKYGSAHVARVATYQTFRGRMAIREIGMALGLPEEILDTLAKRVPWMAHADRLSQMLDQVPELKEFAQYRDQLDWLWKLAAAVAGFPRHFGMHVGGIIISKEPLVKTTSLQPSAKGEWVTPFDKHAVEDVGLVKLDLLSLRTMAAIEDAVVMREHRQMPLDYDAIPLDDKETFAMLGTGETIGVFQLESPAQSALQTRLKADGLEDIVASVALIRPGPIQGNMVDPFLARRRGHEDITYLHPKLEPILGKTYGVVLFQEQVIEIATVIANFTPGEADQLRRVMSHARSAKEMEEIGRLFLEKASQSGISPEVAGTIFSYIQGYASYGFCEAHAAAFAATAYKTAYLVRHYPAEFYASILNQYPMGYYPVHVICAEARRRGILVEGIDINQSEFSCTGETCEGTVVGKMRLGFCMLKGFKKEVATALCEERNLHGPFQSVADCVYRVRGLDSLILQRLIRVGAFDGLHPDQRKKLVWELPSLLAEREVFQIEGGLWDKGLRHTYPRQDKGGKEDFVEFPLAAKLADEYNLMGVGISGHWMDLFRPWLSSSGYVLARAIPEYPDGTLLWTGGLLIRPHRPPTKSGKTVVFFTLEDETGFVDATMFESVYHAGGSILFTPYGRLVGVEGTVQRRDDGRPQLIVSRVWSLGSMT